MIAKTLIAQTLGERSLVLPALVNAGLAANDRAKYYFTLLQAAAARARHPDRPAADLRRERIACGVADVTLDGVPASATLGADGRLSMHGARSIVRSVLAEVEAMLAPLAGEIEPGYGARFEKLRAAAGAREGDTLEAGEVESMTRADRGAGDSLHLLVMDLHKALNAEQARIASDRVDGASAYGLDAADRPLVAAFMRGLGSTAPLKLDHPGLGTTATRDGARLVIQNDIGTTDAHVLIVHVEGLAATLTYSDVHLPRLRFFQNQFDRHAVDWNDTFSRRDERMEDGYYHLCTGRFCASDAAGLEEYLAFLASRLVFLIDWNKARKRLRLLVGKEDAIGLLSWAARANHGHMGFLRAGGELLVHEALDFVLKDQVRFGLRLVDVLGRRESAEFMRFVLRACSEAAQRGEPVAHTQDAVRADLLDRLHTLNDRLYNVVGEHAAFMVEIAGCVRDGLLGLRLPDAASALARGAARAKQWESRADERVNRVREVNTRVVPSGYFRAVVETADNAADELESAAFGLTLLPNGHEDVDASGLAGLAELLVGATQEYVKLVESARCVRRGGAREDVQDFLAAIHRVRDFERAADESQRRVKRALLAGVIEPRALYALLAVVANLEAAADALMHCAMQIRDHVLNVELAR